MTLPAAHSAPSSVRLDANSGTPVPESPVPESPGTPSDRVRELREQLARLEGKGGGERDEADGIRTGCAAFDRLWPGGCVARGSLVEWLEGEEGAGAETLVGLVARAACEGGRKWLVVLDRERQFYPPALAAWGCDWRRVVVVRAQRSEDELWAVDQALRCRAVGAVWWRCERLHDRDFRRLQLAAESGGGVGLLRRPARVAGQPTWADVQWRVEPVPASRDGSGQDCERDGGQNGSGRRLRATVERCRGGLAGRSIELEIDDRSGAMRACEPVRSRSSSDTAPGDSREGSPQGPRVPAARRPAARLRGGL